MLPRKFLSVAMTRGYWDVHLGRIEVPLQDEVLDENAPNCQYDQRRQPK